MRSSMKTGALLGLLCVVVCSGCAVKHPENYEEMAQAYQSAQKAKNIGKMNRLIFWGSMPADVQKRILNGYKDGFDKKVVKVIIDELGEDFEMSRGDYIYPFPPEKEMKVSYENPGNEGGVWVGSSYFLGKKDGKVYILYRSEDKD